MNCEPDIMLKQERDIHLNIKEELEDSLLPPSETEKHIFNELQIIIHINKHIIKQEKEIEEVTDETLLSSKEQNVQKSIVENDIDIKEEFVHSDSSTDKELYSELVKCESLADPVQECDPHNTTSENNTSLNTKASTFSTHPNKIEFQCSICHKIFFKRRYLTKHKKCHSRVKKFVCTICNKKFAHKRSLNVHMKYHTDIKDLKCTICNKKFDQSKDMKIHMKHHLRIKEFECLICKTKFTDKSNLKRHMKYHSDIKDYECTICYKKFTEQCILKLHMKYHLDIKDFECSLCNKRFVQNCELKTHMKFHSCIKDVECSICGKKFVRKIDLKEHIKHHPIINLECTV